MKKYIYGTLLITIIAGVAIFFFRPPETADSPHTTIALTFRFPENYDFTEGAPFSLTWRTEATTGTLSDPVKVKNFNPLVSPYLLVFKPALGSEAAILNARIYYCHKPTRMCFQDTFETRIPLPARQGTSTIAYTWDISPKQTRDDRP